MTWPTSSSGKRPSPIRRKSWSVDVAGIDRATFDLSVKNPNGGDEVALRTPQEILDEIAALDTESAEVLATIRGLVCGRHWQHRYEDWRACGNNATHCPASCPGSWETVGATTRLAMAPPR